MEHLYSFFSQVRTATSNKASQSIANAADVPWFVKYVYAWWAQRRLKNQWGTLLGSIIFILSTLTYSETYSVLKVAIKAIRAWRGNTLNVSSTQPAPFRYSTRVSSWKVVNLQVLWWLVHILGLVSLRCRNLRLPRIGRIPTRKTARWFLAGSALHQAIMPTVKRLRSPIGAWLTTRIISLTLRAGELSSSQQRQVFVDTPLVKSKPTDNHSHPVSASDRNAGGNTAAAVALMLGKKPYFVQQSLADIRKYREGDRSFHWPKDIAIPPSDFTFDPEHHIAILVDVDYYIDMPELLARYPGTYLVYAVMPTLTGTDAGEYSFRFLSDNRLDYQVSGGGNFCHKIWDYSGDTFIVESCGLTIKTVTCYHIDRKYVDPHHCVTMLSVLGTFDVPRFFPTNTILEGSTLNRLEPVFGEHVVLDIKTSSSLDRAVSIVGDHNSVRLPKSKFDALHAVAMVAKVPITPSMVSSNVAQSDPLGLPTAALQPGHAAIIASYTRAGVPDFPPVVYPPEVSCIPIQYDKHDYDAPIPLKAFGSPLVQANYSHASSLASDHQCIKGRVEAFHGRMKDEIPPTIMKLIEAYAERLIPIPHQGVPVDEDTIREKQDRPSQRAILDEAAVSGPFFKRMWRSFKKKEPAQKVTDPRNISTLAGQSKLKTSAFIYAFHKDIMVNQKWYAFSKNPREIAERVAELLREAGWSVLADGSRFDGHVAYILRILERVCLMRWCAKEWHAFLNEALNEMMVIPGVTEEGRRYESGYGRGSGGPDTADMNSVDSSFIGFTGWFFTPNPDKSQRSYDECWEALGIYGGDDSLEGDIDPLALKKASEMLGQEYEITVIHRHEIGVEFLNRQFGPDVWNGDPSSMCNPARALSKLWIGPSHLRNPIARFAERMSGYWRSDRNTPVLGRIAQVTVDLLGEKTEGELMTWNGQVELESNWPNEDSGWMWDCFERFLPDFHKQRFDDWIYWVEQLKNPELLLKAPLCVAEPFLAPVSKVPAIVGDDLVLPAAKPEISHGTDTELRDTLPDQPLPPKDKEDVQEATGGHDLVNPFEADAEGGQDETSSSGGEDHSLAPVLSQPGLPKLIWEVDSNGLPIADQELAKPSGTLPVHAPQPHLETLQAARVVPRSSSTGKRVQTWRSTLPKGTQLHVRDWKVAPKREGESPQDFRARILKWVRTRDNHAKKQGYDKNLLLSPEECFYEAKKTNAQKWKEHNASRGKPDAPVRFGQSKYSPPSSEGITVTTAQGRVVGGK